jgi:hypothetical protein
MISMIQTAWQEKNVGSLLDFKAYIILTNIVNIILLKSWRPELRLQKKNTDNSSGQELNLWLCDLMKYPSKFQKTT